MIEWEGAVDVIGVDFADCVTINARSVVLYEGEQRAEIGEKLNRAALVTLYKVEPKGDRETYVERLKASCVRQGMEFVSYDRFTGKY
jgi:hypothetical protein